MMNILHITHKMNLMLNKSIKNYPYMTKDKVLSLILYYFTRGLLNFRDSIRLKLLCNILGLNSPPEDTIEKLISPLYIDEEENEKCLRSKITRLFIKIPFIREEEWDIAFTPQFNEMLEIIHIGLAIKIPILFEGCIGQGKHLCINYVADLLDYEIINIMISQTTNVEDLIGKKIITKDKNKNLKVISYETKLFKTLKNKYENDKEGKNLIFIFNNLNNASPEVMDFLVSFFDRNQDSIILSEGLIFPKKNINIIGIINPEKGLSKDELPSSLINSSLYHIVSDPDENSIKQIIEKKLEKEIFKLG